MTTSKYKPSTPGEILREEFIEPYGLTQAKLAELTGISRRRINEIVNGKRRVTIDTALRFSKLFEVPPHYWLNLQMKVDLWNEINKRRKRQKRPIIW